jgi:hypothetical protein
MQAFTPNDGRAIALSIGRELAREDWTSMSAPEAQEWCTQRAAEKNVPDAFIRIVAMMAMRHVIS